MRTDLFDYHLPKELIAAEPAPDRTASRLLVVHRATGQFEHLHFADIGRFLNPGDLLVLNDTRVFPARIHGKRLETGGRVEFLLLKRTGCTADPPCDRWHVICRPARKLKPGEIVYFASKKLHARVLHYVSEGEREVEFDTGDIHPWLDRIGEVPLPPYIIQRRREMHSPSGFSAERDTERYQTVYARETGSVAAPTAGLHFTQALLDSLRTRGIEITALTLHVGPGTFKPVETETVEQHPMHTEYFTIPLSCAESVNRARAQKRRIVAVGTTSVRALESVALPDGTIPGGSYETGLLIAPGYEFKTAQALVTNFHLPRSTLLMLVSAFAGRELVLSAYAEAVRLGYRFYSYGDAMLLV